MCVYVCESVYVCDYVFMCVSMWVCAHVCVCVCMSERESEREKYWEGETVRQLACFIIKQGAFLLKIPPIHIASFCIVQHQT